MQEAILPSGDSCSKSFSAKALRRNFRQNAHMCVLRRFAGIAFLETLFCQWFKVSSKPAEAPANSGAKCGQNRVRGAKSDVRGAPKRRFPMCAVAFGMCALQWRRRCGNYGGLSRLREAKNPVSRWGSTGKMPVYPPSQTTGGVCRRILSRHYFRRCSNSWTTVCASSFPRVMDTAIFSLPPGDQ